MTAADIDVALSPAPVEDEGVHAVCCADHRLAFCGAGIDGMAADDEALSCVECARRLFQADATWCPVFGVCVDPGESA